MSTPACISHVARVCRSVCGVHVCAQTRAANRCAPRTARTAANALPVIVDNVRTLRAVETTPAPKMREDAATQANGRSFFQLALRRSRLPAKHHATSKVDPVPSQLNYDA